MNLLKAVWYIQWNMTQPLKRMKYFHLQEHGWTWKLPLSEMCQTKTNLKGYHLYLESKKKKWYKWTYFQNRNRFTYLENKHYYQRGREEGRDNLGVWDWCVHITIFKIKCLFMKKKTMNFLCHSFLIYKMETIISNLCI